jgi:diguanylate cyclase (GGDEF)-like protein
MTLSSWDLWLLPRKARGAVLLTDALALALIVLAWVHYPVHGRDAGIAWLAAGALASIETSRRAERFRERHRDIPHKTLNAMWLLPAAVLFPPGPVCLLVAVGYAWFWWRVVRHSPYRWVFNAATAILGYGSASMIFHAVTGTAGPGLPAGSAVLAACFGAGLVALAVNILLVGLAIGLSRPDSTGRQRFGGPPEMLTESAAICLGVLGAAAFTRAPWLVLAGVPVATLLQRTLLFSQLQRATHTDARTGLATATWWHQLASREVERALGKREEVSVLLADLDNFADVNETWGRQAGDAVLAAVGRELSGSLRTYDVAGRFGGEQFAVLLPATGPHAAREVAERLRRCVCELELSVPEWDGRGYGSVSAGQITMSIGVAALPAQARDLNGLLTRADMALYVAKREGRDLVCYLDGPGEL